MTRQGVLPVMQDSLEIGFVVYESQLAPLWLHYDKPKNAASFVGPLRDPRPINNNEHTA
jgi:hypothetical protein